MKSTGIVRRIDDLGRVVIPKELRRTYEIAEGDPLEIFTTDGGIFIRKYQPVNACTLCGSMDEPIAVTVHGKPICAACVEAVQG